MEGTNEETLRMARVLHLSKGYRIEVGTDYGVKNGDHTCEVTMAFKDGVGVVIGCRSWKAGEAHE